jgi:DNA-directed RNA polymerase specialized sigma subunit
VQLGRSPTIPELAKAAGVEEEGARGARVRPRVHVALAVGRWRGGDDDDLDPLESLGTEEHQYEVSEDRAVLAPGFKALDERERKILQLRFFEG